MINNIEIIKELNSIKIRNVQENLEYLVQLDTKEFSVQKFYEVTKYNRSKSYIFSLTRDNGKNPLDLLFNKVNEIVDKLIKAINDKSKELMQKVQTEDLE